MNILEHTVELHWNRCAQDANLTAQSWSLFISYMFIAIVPDSSTSPGNIFWAPTSLKTLPRTSPLNYLHLIVNLYLQLFDIYTLGKKD